MPHGEDWYVGVAGVPLGPVRLAVIREKALAGAVHADSLVWREGFDEWQPLKTFPELLKIIEEAQAARGVAPRRPSAVPPPPTRPSVLPPVRPPSVAPPPAAKPPGAPGAPGASDDQPKATAIGLGLPAVSLPAKTTATLPSSGTPAVPSTGARPAPAAPTLPAGALPPAARPGAGAARPGALPGPGARPAGASRSGESGLHALPDLSAPRAPTGLAARASSPSLDAFAPPPGAPAAPSAAEPSSPAIASSAVLAGSAAAEVSSPPAPQPSAPQLDAPPADDLFGLGAGAAAGPVSSSAPVVTPAPAAAPAAGGTPLPSGALGVMRDPFAAPPPSDAAVSPAAVLPAAVSPAAAGALAPPAPSMPLPAAPPASLASSDGFPRAPADSPSRASFVPPVPSSTQRLSEPEDVLPRRRQGMHPLAYAFIAMAAAFGGVVAFLLFSKPAQPTIVYVPQPGSTLPSPGPTAVAAPGDTPTAAPAATDVPAADPSAAPRPVVVGGGKVPAPASTATSAPVDTSGFGNQVVPGPTATSTSAGADPSLGQLSAGEIQGVVSSNQARIRKRCWQPALDSASATASGNARVRGKIVIGPSGAVQSATASGAEKDYPGLSSCIAGQMQGWKFPPSSGSTPVEVPFVFAGQ